MPNDNLQPANSQFILYQDDNGVTNVNVRFDGKDVWLTQQQNYSNEIFQRSKIILNRGKIVLLYN